MAKASILYPLEHHSILEKGMGIRALSRTYVYRPHFSYVSININTISEQMGFTLSQCDALVSPQSGIEITSVMEDKEDRGYAIIPRSYPGCTLTVYCT